MTCNFYIFKTFLYFEYVIFKTIKFVWGSFLEDWPCNPVRVSTVELFTWPRVWYIQFKDLSVKSIIYNNDWNSSIRKLDYEVTNLTQLAINYILKDCCEAKPWGNSTRVKKKKSRTLILCSIFWLEKLCISNLRN